MSIPKCALRGYLREPTASHPSRPPAARCCSRRCFLAGRREVLLPGDLLPEKFRCAGKHHVGAGSTDVLCSASLGHRPCIACARSPVDRSTAVSQPRRADAACRAWC